MDVYKPWLTALHKLGVISYVAIIPWEKIGIKLEALEKKYLQLSKFSFSQRARVFKFKKKVLK